MSYAGGTPHGEGHKEPKSKHGGKQSKSSRSKPGHRGSKHGSIPADAVVSLSDQGRALYDQLLEAASIEAGHPVTGEDLLEVMRRVRAELGTDDTDFTIPSHMACLKAQLRSIGKNPPPGGPGISSNRL